MGWWRKAEEQLAGGPAVSDLTLLASPQPVPTTREEIERWVFDLAGREHIQLRSIGWSAKSSGTTRRAWGGGYRITLNPALLYDRDLIGHVAAHELGHAAAGDIARGAWLAPFPAGLATGMSPPSPRNTWRCPCCHPPQDWP